MRLLHVAILSIVGAFSAGAASYGADSSGGLPTGTTTQEGVKALGVPPLTTANDPRRFRRPIILDSQIDGELSALPPSERALMHEVLIHLPVDKRENVYYETLDGTIHSKYGVDRNGAYNIPVPGSSALRNRFGQQVIPPPDSQSPSGASFNCRSLGTFVGTGAYREVYSTCNTPATKSTVYLPCRNYSYFAYPQSEIGYIYSGGFSANGNAIDAGMQYSSALDNYTVFIRGKYGQMSPDPIKYPNAYLRFGCGQYVSLEFEPYDSTHLDVFVDGTNVNGAYQPTLFLYQVQAADGWSPQCGNCVVKRVTSLAQSYDSFRTGSSFGVAFSGGQPLPEVAWSNSQVGFYRQTINGRGYYSAIPWYAQYTGGFVNYPNDGSRIVVNYQNSANEVDGIYLHH